MLLASVSFIPHFDHEEAELLTVAEAHLGTLLKNGQICGNYVAGWSDGAYTAWVYLSHRKAADDGCLSKWGQKTLASVKRQFGCEPIWEILDDEAAARTPTLKSAKSLYLFAHSLKMDSPVCHGSRGTSLPLPLLPISDLLREELFDWSESCRCHDRIFMESGALELASYQQLANARSELAKHGRELTRALETALGKPCYYYLLRHWADPRNEDDRLCPSCGSVWRDPQSPMPSKEPFHRFHFSCTDCRLVSHRGVIVEDNDNWKIGMFNETGL